MQHDVPLHSTSLTKWRQRVGVEKLVELLQETIALAVREKHVTKQELARVNVDTTVQEKNITHPTDEAAPHGDHQVGPRGQESRRPTSSNVRSRGEESGADGQPLRAREAVQTHASHAQEIADVAGPNDPRRPSENCSA
jgi:hypothetical protein